MMNSAGSLNDAIHDIVKKLASEYAPQRVILFGSHAYGNPKPDSDIDLFIIKETSERFLERWITVRRILSDPHRTFALETIVLTPQELDKRLAIGDHFIIEVLEKGKTLYEA